LPIAAQDAILPHRKPRDADALEMDRIETGMTLNDYKVVLYRNQPSGWVAEVPAIEGCYALMPTRQEALAELGRVFQMISEEFQEKHHGKRP
jgi:predicted RNase H-like HicB family nuclease